MPTYFETELALRAALIRQLRKQNADLVAALEATQKLLDDIYAEDSIISSSDLGAVYEGNNQAIAQVGGE